MRRLLSVLPLLVLLVACGGGDDGNPISPTAPVRPQRFTLTAGRVGAGREAVDGKRRTRHYARWLFSLTGTDNEGQPSETSVGGPPYSFTLGGGQVIPGWDQGLVGRKVDGIRRL